MLQSRDGECPPKTVAALGGVDADDVDLTDRVVAMRGLGAMAGPESPWTFVQWKPTRRPC